MNVPSEFTDEDLRAWFDEALPPDQMTRLETRLRTDPLLQQRAARVLAEREGAGPSVGDVWRQYRLSCPQRETWGSWLLGVLEPELADYLKFHLEVVGCRYCQANLADLQAERESSAPGNVRREKIFESSAGHLRRWRDE